jgi:prepilin-type N-terminal cleavage/methylation domain-containing protein
MTPASKPTAIRNAFTLIEMMIVIGIIALLAALTLGISNSVLRNSEISRTRDAMRLFDMALQEWELELGRPMTFRDFSMTESWDASVLNFRFDVTDWPINPKDEPLLGVPTFNEPVDDGVMLEVMGARMKNLVIVLLESESARDILLRISPRYFMEMDLNEDGVIDAVTDGKVGVDAWGNPIGIVFPCQRYNSNDFSGNVLPKDECGDLSVRGQAEDGLGSCIGRRPYFVSAGPDRLWGYRYQASSPIPNQNENEDWVASLDNIYSYTPYLVEESR